MSYRVRYLRWTSYVLQLRSGFGLAGVGLLLTMDVRGYIARHPAQTIHKLVRRLITEIDRPVQ